MLFCISQITDSKSNSILKLYNDTSEAEIFLNQGASLQKLKLKNHLLIEDLDPIAYKDSYASSILFPFANRVKDGKYTFNNYEYQLKVNHVAEQNAIHGLVYNKEFQLVHQQITDDNASVILEYEEKNTTQGFPFIFKIQLEYILTNTSLDLNVSVQNTSKAAFPFTLGWHPYFISSDLHKSHLKFDSTKCIVFDDRMITSDTIEIKNEGIFEVKNKKLDDCFFLNSNKVEFKTPLYKLEMLSSEQNDFLQVYTPPRENTIAIEPTTGISNSFNNKIGLRTLQPNEDYKISWKLKIE